MVSQSSAAHSDHTETEQTGRREEAQCSPGGFLSGSAWLHPGVRMTLAQQETLPHPPPPPPGGCQEQQRHKKIGERR